MIPLENEPYNAVMGSGIGNSNAPFIQRMLQSSGTAPSYNSYPTSGMVNNCSFDCYTAVTSGQEGINNCSTDCVQSFTFTSIFDELVSHGLTWKGFCEDTCTRQGDHFPPLQYASTQASPQGSCSTTGEENCYIYTCITCSDTVSSFSQMIDELNSPTPASYIWFAPSDCHNMHGTSGCSGGISAGDGYLQQMLVGSGTLSSPGPGSLLSTLLFTSGTFKPAIYLWWDECNSSPEGYPCDGNNDTPNLLYQPNLSNPYISTDSLDEYATLRMIEDNWSLGCILNDCAATSMKDFFTPSISASFSYSPAMPTTGTIVAFAGSFTGGVAPYAYSWSFGDGLTGSGATTSHNYNSPGQYIVTLTAMDSAKVTASSAQTLIVTSLTPSIVSVSFTFSPVSPTTGTSISFAATPSGGTPPYTYIWDFGDGAPSATAAPSHTYSIAGAYTVTVTVTDANGLTGSASQQVTTTSQQPPVQLLAGFTYSPLRPTAGSTVNFSPSATGGTSPYSFSWDFGDGTTSTASQPSHTYANQRSFTVTLTVADSAADSITLSATLQVVSQPLPLSSSFGYSPSVPVAGATVTFTSTVNGGTAPYLYSWNSGDGNTRNGPSFGHVYTNAGNYSIILTVTDSTGNIAREAQQVNVRSTSPSSRPPEPNNHPNSGGTCVLCNITHLAPTSSSILITGFFSGIVLSVTVFLARYHGQNRRLGYMLAQGRQAALLADPKILVWSASTSTRRNGARTATGPRFIGGSISE